MPNKFKDKSVNQFVKLLIQLEILITSKENSGNFILHNDSWQISRDYVENNVDSFQELIQLFDITRSSPKGTK